MFFLFISTAPTIISDECTWLPKTGGVFGGIMCQTEFYGYSLGVSMGNTKYQSEQFITLGIEVSDLGKILGDSFTESFRVRFGHDYVDLEVKVEANGKLYLKVHFAVEEYVIDFVGKYIGVGKKFTDLARYFVKSIICKTQFYSLGPNIKLFLC